MFIQQLNTGVWEVQSSTWDERKE